MEPSKQSVVWIVLGVVLGAAAFLTLVPPIPQDQAYHAFADRRTMFGIPNFWDVISNLPFAMIGIIGIRRARDAPMRVLFAGVLLTFFGSAYYHLVPSDARLVWDRLPMTLVFMSLVACVFSESTLIPLLICGAGSVLWWRVTGDLRPYALVQFGSMLALLPALWFVPRTRGLWPVYVLYVLAKLAEYYDRAIFAAMPVSGHTLKHLFAALAAYWILRWMRARDNSSEVFHNSRRTSGAGSGILRP